MRSDLGVGDHYAVILRCEVWVIELANFGSRKGRASMRPLHLEVLCGQWTTALLDSVVMSSSAAIRKARVDVLARSGSGHREEIPRPGAQVHAPSAGAANPATEG